LAPDIPICRTVQKCRCHWVGKCSGLERDTSPGVSLRHTAQTLRHAGCAGVAPADAGGSLTCRRVCLPPSTNVFKLSGRRKGMARYPMEIQPSSSRRFSVLCVFLTRAPQKSDIWPLESGPARCAASFITGKRTTYIYARHQGRTTAYWFNGGGRGASICNTFSTHTISLTWLFAMR